jgi:uncharacterized protein (TIGR02996 family)
MTDRAALYAAVCANPDDTVRLAFADRQKGRRVN